LLGIHLAPQKNGHSVLAHVTDFLPYFYVPVPRGFQASDIGALKELINSTLDIPDALRQVEIVHKRSLWGYRGDVKPVFLKLTISDPKTLPKVRGLFERGELQFRDLFPEPITTYESNIIFVLRFMVDTKVSE
jgi:DNA polymerase delta subunit 1